MIFLKSARQEKKHSLLPKASFFDWLHPIVDIFCLFRTLCLSVQPYCRLSPFNSLDCDSAAIMDTATIS